VQSDKASPEPSAEIAGIVIVMLGDFNPAILHPAWFKANQLLRAGDADAATVEVVATSP
jgi:hypothetical protein